MNSTEHNSLIRKYNVPGPRYTSYPTVPHWKNSSSIKDRWKEMVVTSCSASMPQISLYIHLPFCESLCTFCGCNTRITVNHAVEEPYIETVLQEWAMYISLMKHKPVIRELHLGGGTPTFFKPENLERLITGIKEQALVAYDAELSFEGHPGNTTRAHLETLYRLGFRRVSFGIQDFDLRVQEVINRVQTFEQVKQVTEDARSIGYTSVNFDILYGLPLQRLRSMKETMTRVKQLRPDRIAFYSYAHVPWIKPGQRRFTEMDLPDDEVKRALYEYGREALEQAGYEEIGMDHFALKTDTLYQSVICKTLHRNFMGYTSSHSSLLIGLGVSSISDLGGVFAQNVKTVEEYSSLVTSGELPVCKGHVLSSEDLILKQHILNIMCRVYTSWAKPGEQCTALFNGIGRMKELEKDGLVKLGLYSLDVTPKGRPFIRNICMALDAYLQTPEKKTIQFSKII